MVEFQFFPRTDGRSSFTQAVGELGSPISELHVSSPNLTVERVQQFQDNYDGDLHDVHQEWIVGLGGLTEFQALEKIRTEFDADVYVTNDGQASFSSVGFGSTLILADRDKFHDLFIGGGGHGQIRAQSGSFGMTLTDLHQTVHESELHHVRSWWNSMQSSTIEYTSGVANQYSKLWNEYPDWVLSIRGIPIPRTPSNLPKDATLFWSEVRSAQGASQSQIDLPRRTYPFFTRYEGSKKDDEILINIIAGGEYYAGKEVRQHVNQMIRPNIPTELLENFDLIDSVVVFYHLQGNDFGLVLIPSVVADGYATLLERFCNQDGTVHEMKSGRTCGWV